MKKDQNFKMPRKTSNEPQKNLAAAEWWKFIDLEAAKCFGLELPNLLVSPAEFL
jgi:hypothetical protein